MKNRLLENLSAKLESEVTTRRYNLSDMISESYKALYATEEGTNLRKLAESHLEDVKKNPSEIDRLSRNLSTLKQIVSLTESGKLKDSDLAERPKRIKESRTVRGRKLKDSAYPRANSREELKQQFQQIVDSEVSSYGNVTSDTRLSIEDCGFKLMSDYTVEEDYLAQEKARKGLDHATRSKNESRRVRGRKSECDSPRKRDLNDSENLSFAKRPSKKDLEEDASTTEVNNPPMDDEDLTDEEVEELAKYLEKIRKEKKTAPAKSEEAPKEREGNPAYKAPVKEESNPRKGIRCKTHESRSAKSYSDMRESLKSFSESSATKAFYKTLKKMHESLKEGTALTRKESIDLYKAANSAMTQMSIELEHNPEFLSTFNECTTLLSADVSSILGALNEGKAPSKKTMKSLAKFYESLLMEAEDEDEEEENLPVEDEVDTDDDFVGDEEGDIESEEAEAFNQEYADARVELHKELAAKHSDNEDPAVQEKIEQDAAEVMSLPGITDEQIAELNGETPEEGEEEPEDPEEEEPVEDEDEISDDELEELKKYLKEMRESKKRK